MRTKFVSTARSYLLIWLAATIVATVDCSGVFTPAAIAQTECPSSQFNTMYWLTTPDGMAHQQSGVDFGTTNTLYSQSRNWFTGPTNAPGIFTVCRETYFRDNGAIGQAGKNAFVSINHLFGVGTSPGNQDRALWISAANPAKDTADRYGLEVLQMQLDINGSPNFVGSPDGEASALSVQAADHHIGDIWAPTNFGANGMRVTYSRATGAGNWKSGGAAGARIRSTNYSVVPGNDSPLIGLALNVNDLTSGKSVGIAGVALEVGSPLQDYTGGRFPSYNWGVHIQDFGANVSDYNIYSASSGHNSGKNLFQGPVIINREIRTGTTANTDLAGVGVIPFMMTFTEDYTLPPVCTVTETTALNPIMVRATTTGFVVSGTGGDSFAYICIARN